MSKLMNENCMVWKHRPGHYEVWYVTLTDPGSGLGFWIRYTMVAPINGDATCSLWLMAMDPGNPGRNVGEKLTYPIESLKQTVDPFRLQIGNASLSDFGASGSIEADGKKYSWDLSWQPRLPSVSLVHPLLRKAKIAKTIVVMPHADLEIDGVVELDGDVIQIKAARGGQTHLWGSKHASRWAWAHCSDFVSGEQQLRNTYFEGVSVFLPRFGRELGPNTPVLARIGGRDLHLTGPVGVMRNKSEFGPTSWQFEAKGHRHKLAGEISTRMDDLVGVTYHDPDGEKAYCYNTEVADMELDLYVREGFHGDWHKTDHLESKGRTHFEYAQREPVEGARLMVS